MKFRRGVCAVLGHRWNNYSLCCSRCRRTAEEIERGPIDRVVEQRVSAAYWRGVSDGRSVDRRRAYRLGFMRGGRDVFGRVETVLSRNTSPGLARTESAESCAPDGKTSNVNGLGSGQRTPAPDGEKERG